MTNLTATQSAALARIVAKWDAANAANLARWGAALNYGVSVTTGTGDDPVTRNVRTLHVLAEAGLIPFTYSLASFTALRPYEFVRNGPVLHRLPVRLVGVVGTRLGQVPPRLGPRQPGELQQVDGHGP